MKSNIEARECAQGIRKGTKNGLEKGDSLRGWDKLISH